MTMSSNQPVWCQLLNCYSPEIVHVATSSRNQLMNASKTAILERIVCAILLEAEDPLKPYGKGLKKMMQESSTKRTCLRKLCEISYQRCLNKDTDDFLGHALPEFIKLMQKEPKFLHFLDPRTQCDVYPPASTTNTYLPAVALLERFFAAIHILFQPERCVIAVADLVLQQRICKDVLVFYCGLAARQVSPAAFEILPLLLQHLRQKITTEDVNKTSLCLRIVIKCLYEAKDPHFLNLIQCFSENLDVRGNQKAACPLDYFLMSRRGQRVAKICANEKFDHHLDDDKANRLGAQRKKSRTLLPQQVQGPVMVQPSSDRSTSSTKDDSYTAEVNIPMPRVFINNETDGVSLKCKINMNILSNTNHHKCFDIIEKFHSRRNGH